MRWSQTHSSPTWSCALAQSSPCPSLSALPPDSSPFCLALCVVASLPPATRPHLRPPSHFPQQHSALGPIWTPHHPASPLTVYHGVACLRLAAVWTRCSPRIQPGEKQRAIRPYAASSRAGYQACCVVWSSVCPCRGALPALVRAQRPYRHLRPLPPASPSRCRHLHRRVR